MLVTGNQPGLNIVVPHFEGKQTVDGRVEPHQKQLAIGCEQCSNRGFRFWGLANARDFLRTLDMNRANARVNKEMNCTF